MSYRSRGRHEGFRGRCAHIDATQYQKDDDDGDYMKFSSSMSGQELMNFFQKADGQNYGRLKDLVHVRSLWEPRNNISIFFSRIQSDPYAPGSQISVSLPIAGIVGVIKGSAVRKLAVEDCYLRQFYQGVVCDHRIELLRPSQNVIERSAVRINEDTVTFNVRAKLPGNGRRIDGRGCVSILNTLRNAAQKTCQVALDHLIHVCDCNEDQQYLRNQLDGAGLVAFVPNDAILPRISGDNDGPMENAVPFKSPLSLQCSFQLPRQGKEIVGMGIPKGITVIVGGGFHGKSTLLRSLEVGVYNKVIGDGREYVVSDEQSVKIRAEDRRSVNSVDISSFINNIPFGRPTKTFSTTDASGSTSQASNIVEALELGASVLLIDEDTCATNLMVRDCVMKQLITEDKEPITPFIDRAQILKEQRSVSTVLVAGGSGAFLNVADHVIMMDSYLAHDVTERAHTLTPYVPIHTDSALFNVFEFNQRVVDVRKTFKELDVYRAKCGGHKNGVRLGDQEVDLHLVEQLVEEGQYNAIAMCLAWMHKNGQNASVSACVDNAIKEMNNNELEIPNTVYYAARGFVAMPRKFEIAAALNRLRTLMICLK